MNNNNDNSGFDNFKSLLFNTATMGPIAIGLGISLRNGFNTLKTNNTSLNPKTNFSKTAMIGRSTGINLADSLKKARGVANKGNLGSGSNFFAATSKMPGPERSALISAVKNMLNSPYLGLTETQIKAESDSISSMSTDSQFETFMNGKIDFYKNRIGNENVDDFVSTLEDEYNKILKINNTIGNLSLSNNPIDFKQGSILNTEELSLSEIKSGKYGKEVKNRLSTLEKMIGDAGISRKFSIHHVTHPDQSSAIIATISTNKGGMSIPIPLQLRRNAFLKSAKGGIMHIPQKGKFTSQIVMPSALIDLNSEVMAGEDFIIEQFGKFVGSLKGTSNISASNMTQKFKESVYGTGQVLSRFFTPVAASEAFLHGYKVQVRSKSEPFVAGNEIQERSLFNNKNIKYYGLSPSALASNNPFVMDINAPTAESLFMNEDQYRQKSRIHQMQKPYTVLKGNTKLLDVMDWTENSQVGIGLFNDSEVAMEMIKMQSAGRISGLAFYEFETSNDINGWRDYRHRYNVYEGGALGKSKPIGSFKNYTFSPTFNINDKTLQSPLTKIIIENFNKGKTSYNKKEVKELFNQIKLLGKKEGINLSFKDIQFLGFNGSSSVDLDFDFRHMQQLNILGIEKDPNGSIKLGIDFFNRPQQTMKIHGVGSKNVIVSTTDQILEKEFTEFGNEASSLAFNFIKGINSTGKPGENPLKRITRSLYKFTTSQIERSPGTIHHQMRTGATLIGRALGLSENETTSFFKGLSISNGDDMFENIVNTLRSKGASNEMLAGVLSLWWKKGASSNLKNKYSNDTSLINALEKSKGVIGIETAGIAKVGPGSGKPGSLERRSINAMLQHFNTLNLTEKEQISILSDYLSRSSSNSSRVDRLFTHLAFSIGERSSVNKSPLDLIKEFSNNWNWKPSIGDVSLTELRKTSKLNPFTSEWYLNNHFANIKFDTNEKVSNMAKKIFGSDNLVIPTIRSLPALNTMLLKENGKQAQFSNEFNQSLDNLIKITSSPHSSEEEISNAMKEYKNKIAKGYLVSGELLTSGKIAGSAQGDLQSLNKAFISPSFHKRLTSLAANDGYRTVFINDANFFGAIKSQAGFIKRNYKNSAEFKNKQNEVIDKVRNYIFNSQKEDGAIYGMQIRHPTLGEGHVSTARIRRLGGAAQNHQLMSLSFVRKFLRDKYNIKGEVRKEHLKKLLKSKDKQLQTEFAALLTQKAANFSGQSIMYFPLADGSFKTTVNGKEQLVPHTFSRFLSQFGDADGDTGTIMISFNNEATQIYRRIMNSNRDITTSLTSDIEFKIMLEQAKNVQTSKQDLNLTEQLFQGKLKEVYSKKVGYFSEQMDILKSSVLAFGKDSNLTRQGVNALTILEEILSLKSKKMDIAQDIASRFADAVKSGDKEAARTIINQHAFNLKNKIEVDPNSININNFMNGQEKNIGKILIDFDAIFENIWSSFNEYKEAGGSTSRSFKQAIRRLNTSDYDDYTLRMIESLRDDNNNFMGSLIRGLVHGNKINELDVAYKTSSKILNSLSSVLSNSKTLIPVGIGIASSVALSGILDTSDQKAATPTEQELNFNPNSSIVQSVLDTLQKDIAGINMPSVDQSIENFNHNKIIENETYIQPNNSFSGEFLLNDIKSIPQFNKILQTSGVGVNHFYIQDNRRPITKNYLDQLSEE